MAKRSNQKAKLLYLSKILLEQTDELHGLTLTQLMSELEKYGIPAGRKSLYDDIETLRVFGLDICTRRDRYVRYYIAGKSEELAALKIIADGISACKYADTRLRDAHIYQLKKFGGARRSELAQLLDNDVDVSDGNSVGDGLKNLSVICRAIISNKKLKFKYFQWNSKKQRILLSGGEYIIVSPWRLFTYDGGYMLAAFNSQKDEVELFSLSRMVMASVEEKSREGELEFEEYSRRELGGQMLRLQCDDEAAGAVFEHFGTGVTVLANRDGYFQVSVRAAVDDNLFSWLFLQRGRVTILSPEYAANEYAARVLDVAAKK